MCMKSGFQLLCQVDQLDDLGPQRVGGRGGITEEEEIAPGTWELNESR